MFITRSTLSTPPGRTHMKDLYNSWMHGRIANLFSILLVSCLDFKDFYVCREQLEIKWSVIAAGARKEIILSLTTLQGFWSIFVLCWPPNTSDELAHTTEIRLLCQEKKICNVIMQFKESMKKSATLVWFGKFRYYNDMQKMFKNNDVSKEWKWKKF